MHKNETTSFRQDPGVEKLGVETESMRAEIRGVKPEQVLQVAEKYWNPIMVALRKERGHRVIDEWGSFNLPLEHHPGRTSPLAALCTIGCKHFLRGGCTMCDYGSASERPTVEKQMREADEAMEQLEKSNLGYDDYGFFNINAVGSFFDDNEMYPNVRRHILERIAANKPKHLRVEMATETRLEYVTEEKLKEFREILGDDVSIEVGIGIESLDPLVREGCVNKHLPKDYLAKIALLKKYGMKIAGHLQIKPPFVTERETVEDVVASARELYGKDLVDKVIIMTMNSRPSTLVGKLDQEGKYEMPSHWSVVEIMRQLGKKLCHETRFFGFIVMDPKIKVVRGCEECNDIIMPLILDFSGNGDEYDRILAAADSLNCPCKREWQQKMTSQPDATLAERVATGLDTLGQEYLGKNFKQMQEK